MNIVLHLRIRWSQRAARSDSYWIWLQIYWPSAVPVNRRWNQVCMNGRVNFASFSINPCTDRLSENRGEKIRTKHLCTNAHRRHTEIEFCLFLAMMIFVWWTPVGSTFTVLYQLHCVAGQPPAPTMMESVSEFKLEIVLTSFSQTSTKSITLARWRDVEKQRNGK